MLLQFELWTNTDHISTTQDRELVSDPTNDQLFTFASSLKQVFLGRFPVSAIQQPILKAKEHVRHRRSRQV